MIRTTGGEDVEARAVTPSGQRSYAMLHVIARSATVYVTLTGGEARQLGAELLAAADRVAP